MIMRNGLSTGHRLEGPSEVHRMVIARRILNAAK